MLDIRRIRENPEEMARLLSLRGPRFDFAELLDKDAKRRGLNAESESLKARRNAVSKDIPRLKKEGQDVAALMDEMKEVGERIKELDEEIASLDRAITEEMLSIPNTTHATTPTGKDETENVEVRRFLEPTRLSFTPRPHWDLGTALDILDFETAASVTGARFTFYKGLGSRLERSLSNFMLNTHTAGGKYTEVMPPYIVHERSMYGTGQLPKFAEDAFKLQNSDYYLIPTAEVPVTNMYRGKILDGADLPLRHTAYSACFRSEAGSAGRDTRGVIRNHQFSKVELVKLARPDQSYEELEALTADAENILRLLKLPYRVIALCTGDIGFCAAKCYDIEVWMPSYNRYVEISSCSNDEDFQARRANIRYKDEGGRLNFVHTLNGSGLAVGRTLAAVLENYQNEDGSIAVPEVLVPYMGTELIK